MIHREHNVRRCTNHYALITKNLKKGLTFGNICVIILVPRWGFIFLSPCEGGKQPTFGNKGSTNSGGADMRVKVTLACTECKQRNYVSKKNKKNDPDRIEMMKHCKFCRKHTLHKETK
jgi:large subunit ribosomal protein L33